MAKGFSAKVSRPVSRLSSIVDKVDQFGRSDVFVGLNAGNFEERDEDEFTMAEIGAVHEFGSDDGSIPQREWLSVTFRHFRRDVFERQRSTLSSIYRSENTNVEREMSRLGLWGVSRVRDYIMNVGPGVWEDISQSTKDAKGSTRILVDTGQMMGSITYVLKDRGVTTKKSRPRGATRA